MNRKEMPFKETVGSISHSLPIKPARLIVTQNDILTRVMAWIVHVFWFARARSRCVRNSARAFRIDWVLDVACNFQSVPILLGCNLVPFFVAYIHNAYTKGTWYAEKAKPNEDVQNKVA